MPHPPLTQSEMETLLDLCERLYASEQEKSGMITPRPYVWLDHNTDGRVWFTPWRGRVSKIQSLLDGNRAWLSEFDPVRPL